ncbi:resolvase, N terminal domain protein [Desulfosporosinus sp. OT]|nr:resolvase, N terminal domain protein [Desulfosporosinus sp. OT]
MSRIIRAASYARYSSDNQREESITAQNRAIEEYCKRKGYALVKRYADEAKSATTDNRSDFQRMIEESALGVFEVVVVHKFDRFARNRYDSAFYKRKLKLNLIKVESVLEQLDNSPESVILESVLEGMAEYYSKNLAREVRKGLNENAMKATHNGGRPPYGLKVNPKTQMYEIDVKRYKAVQMYFEGLDADLTRAEIARLINRAGFRTYTGDEFKITSFDTWATNPKYKGDYVWNASSSKDESGKRNSHLKKPIEEQIILKGAIPAIVPEDLWERVNAKLKKRESNSEKVRLKAKAVYLLSGKVFCFQCGNQISGESYTSRGRKYAYYKCSSKCENKGIPKGLLENVVIDKLIEICFSPEAIQRIVEKVQKLYKEKQGTVTNDAKPLKEEIASLEAKINNWIDAIGDGVLDRNILATKIKEANEKKVFLTSQLAQVEIIQKTPEIDDAAIIKVLNNRKAALLSDNPTDQKAVIQEYVDTINVFFTGDKKLDIEITVKFNMLGVPMVEARGFAPLYRRAATKASTRVSFILSFASLDS